MKRDGKKQYYFDFDCSFFPVEHVMHMRGKKREIVMVSFPIYKYGWLRENKRAYLFKQRKQNWPVDTILIKQDVIYRTFY